MRGEGGEVCPGPDSHQGVGFPNSESWELSRGLQVSVVGVGGVWEDPRDPELELSQENQLTDSSQGRAQTGHLTNQHDITRVETCTIHHTWLGVST